MIKDVPEYGVFHGVIVLLLLRQLENLLCKPGDVIAILLHGAGLAAVEVQVEKATGFTGLEKAIFQFFVSFLKFSQ